MLGPARFLEPFQHPDFAVSFDQGLAAQMELVHNQLPTSLRGIDPPADQGRVIPARRCAVDVEGSALAQSPQLIEHLTVFVRELVLLGAEPRVVGENLRQQLAAQLAAMAAIRQQ